MAKTEIKQIKPDAKEQFKKMFSHTDRDLELIRNTFRTRELMTAIRKHLWQMPMEKEEKSLIERNIGSEAIGILEKTLIPKLGSTDSLEEMKDIWLFDFENMTPQYSMLSFKIRRLVSDYFKQQLLELGGNVVLEKIYFARLSDFQDKTDEEAYIEMAARNMIARETQKNLWHLYFLAVPPETQEEIMERMKKDSSK